MQLTELYLAVYRKLRPPNEYIKPCDKTNESLYLHMPNHAHNNPEQPQVAGLDPHHRIEELNRDQPTPGRDNNNNTKTYKKRANINIATLNMNGATAPTSNMDLKEKWSMINNTIRTNKIAILALQETHLDEE